MPFSPFPSTYGTRNVSVLMGGPSSLPLARMSPSGSGVAPVFFFSCSSLIFVFLLCRRCRGCKRFQVEWDLASAAAAFTDYDRILDVDLMLYRLLAQRTHMESRTDLLHRFS